MSEFSAAADLDVRVSEESLSNARRRIESELGDIGVGAGRSMAPDGGRPGGGRALGQRAGILDASRRQLEEQQTVVELAEERNELLEDLTQTGGGGGGGLGAFGLGRFTSGGGGGGGRSALTAVLPFLLRGGPAGAGALALDELVESQGLSGGQVAEDLFGQPALAALEDAFTSASQNVEWPEFPEPPALGELEWPTLEAPGWVQELFGVETPDGTQEDEGFDPRGGISGRRNRRIPFDERGGIVETEMNLLQPGALVEGVPTRPAESISESERQMLRDEGRKIEITNEGNVVTFTVGGPQVGVEDPQEFERRVERILDRSEQEMIRRAKAEIRREFQNGGA